MSSPLNLSEILDQISDGICVWAPDGHPAFINAKASQILEQADQEFQDNLDRARKARSTACFECFHARLDRWFEHRMYPNVDGSLTLISCDVTSRRQNGGALQSSEERL